MAEFADRTLRPKVAPSPGHVWPLFQQSGYGSAGGGASGGQVNPNIATQTRYSYSCSANPPGGIIIVQPPR